jgi:hypothetical protein
MKEPVKFSSSWNFWLLFTPLKPHCSHTFWVSSYCTGETHLTFKSNQARFLSRIFSSFFFSSRAFNYLWNVMGTLIPFWQLQFSTMKIWVLSVYFTFI